MPNYQDSNIFANIFCDFVSRNIADCSETSPFSVYFIELDIVNKKNLELYSFDLIISSLKMITDKIIATADDDQCVCCYIGMDELVLITKTDEENHRFSKEVFQICEKFKITEFEYLNIPIYIGHQKITDPNVDLVKLFNDLLVNELKNTKENEVNSFNTKIQNAKFFREQILLKKIQFL